MSDDNGRDAKRLAEEALRLAGVTADRVAAAPAEGATLTDEDGAILLDEVSDFTARYVVLPSAATLAAVALWVVHSHAIDAADATPYLSVQSVEKRSGKSRLLDVLRLIVPNPLAAANVSEAALFRALATPPPPTLFLDEVDTVFGPKAKRENESLRGLLNSGYRRGTPAIRMAGQGTAMKVERFELFGAKALAGIGELPDTLTDRSIVVAMKRRAKGETVERLRRRDVEPKAAALRARLAAWVEARIDALRDARPDLPDALDDRAADAWEPLLAIADAAGGEWPERARRAALALAEGREDTDSDSLGVRLLADCKQVFQTTGEDKVPSAALATALAAMEEAPWGDLWGKPLDPRGLAKKLRPYGVHPRTLKLHDGGTAKGYHRSGFEDAWGRYCPERPEPPREAPAAVTTVTLAPRQGLRPLGDRNHDPAVTVAKTPQTRMGTEGAGRLRSEGHNGGQGATGGARDGREDTPQEVVSDDDPARGNALTLAEGDGWSVWIERGPVATPLAEMAPCGWCGGIDYWRSRAGQYRCRRCHPPAPGAEGREPALDGPPGGRGVS